MEELIEKVKQLQISKGSEEEEMSALKSIKQTVDELLIAKEANVTVVECDETLPYDLRSTPSRSVRNEASVSMKQPFIVQNGAFSQCTASGSKSDFYDLRLTPPRIQRQTDTTISSPCCKKPKEIRVNSTGTSSKENFEASGEFINLAVQAGEKEFLREPYDLRCTPSREIRQKMERSEKPDSENEAANGPFEIKNCDGYPSTSKEAGMPRQLYFTIQNGNICHSTVNENKSDLNDSYNLRLTPSRVLRQVGTSISSPYDKKPDVVRDNISEIFLKASENFNESSMKADEKGFLRKPYDLQSTSSREIRQKSETSSDSSLEKEAKNGSLENNFPEKSENSKEPSIDDEFPNNEPGFKPLSVSNFPSIMGKKLLFNEDSINKLTGYLNSPQFGEKIKTKTTYAEFKENQFEAPF